MTKRNVFSMRLLCLLLMLAMVFALAACAGDDATTTTTAGGDGDTTTAAPTDDEKEPITITYLNWNGGEEMRLQQEAIAEYTERFDYVDIQGEWVTENYDSKINTLIAASETPDIYYINEYLAVEWGEKGVALDMAPLFLDMGINMVDTYVPSAVFTYEGKVYGLSTGPVCLLLYYNKAMFDEYGVEYPSTDPYNPWTWDDLVDAAKLLTFDTSGNQPGDDGFTPRQIRSYGMIVPSFWLFQQPFLYSAGAGYGNDDGTATGLDNDGGRRVLQEFHDLIHVHQVSPDAAIAETLPGTTQAFQNNQIAMTVTGTWVYQNFMAEEVDFGVAPLPLFDEPMNISWAATNQISAKTENPAEVAQFLKFLTDPDDNPRQLAINFPNKFSWYEDESKLNAWIDGGNFLPDFKEVIPPIMADIAVVPENVNLKNFNRLVGEIAQAEIDKFLAGSQDLDTTIANIISLSEGNWDGKW